MGFALFVALEYSAQQEVNQTDNASSANATITIIMATPPLPDE